MKQLDRRSFLGSSVAAAGLVGVGSSPGGVARAATRRARPSIGSGGRPTPPVRLAKLAADIGQGQAVTFVDLAALDANLAVYTRFAARQNWAVRPALKSFQCPQLIAYTLRRLRSPRGMPFSLRTVDEVLRVAPRNTDLMLGYPPSVGALEHFLGTRAPRQARGQRVRIMIDSVELLETYARLARRARRDDHEVALQLESGFELSGIRTEDELREVLKLLRTERRNLRLTAVMNYDGHAAAVPDLGFRTSVVEDSSARFARWLTALRRHGQGLYDEKTLVRNGPASSSYRLWAGKGSVNEMSPGAGILFHGYITRDGHDNAGLRPTLHHAAPVFRKTVPRVPGSDDPVAGTEGKASFAVAGGAWPNNEGTPAEPVFPAGSTVDEFSGGLGNNQSNFLLPTDSLERGDYMVFRPAHAGDAVDHFGALVAVRGGRARRVWRTFRDPGIVSLS